MPKSLKDLCLKETASLLRTNNCPQIDSENEKPNPFALFPHTLVEKLLSILYKEEDFVIEDLYLLLTSGRIKEFVLNRYVPFSLQQIVTILDILSRHAVSLEKLILPDLCEPTYNDWLLMAELGTIVETLLSSYNIKTFEIELPLDFTIIQKVESLKTLKLCFGPLNIDYTLYHWLIINQPEETVQNLLLSCRNLETLEIGIPFDLRLIQQLPLLQTLKLGFVPQNSLRNMLPQVGDVYSTNDKMTYFGVPLRYGYIFNSIALLNVSETSVEDVVPIDELVFILKHMIVLKGIDNSIARCLELLHRQEWENGNLTKQYKLQKIKLGCAKSSSVSVSTMNIARATCPGVTELEAFVTDNDAIITIRSFKNLKILSVTCNSKIPLDFQLELKLTVETIGAKLRKLTINNFDNVDLLTFQLCCPNLTYLKVVYQTLCSLDAVPYFEHLDHLHLESKVKNFLPVEILIQLIDQCPKLYYLHLCRNTEYDTEVRVNFHARKHCEFLSAIVFSS